MEQEFNNDDDDDDDWENIVIPDLIKEREKRLLEERKKVEEADVELSKDLFNKKDSPSLFTDETPRIIEFPHVNEVKTFRRINMRKQEQQIKEIKIKNKRIKDIFGETKLDEYYVQYGDIEDKY